MSLTATDRARLERMRAGRSDYVSEVNNAARKLAIAVDLWDANGRTGNYGMTEDLAEYRRARRRLDLRCALDKIRHAAVTS